MFKRWLHKPITYFLLVFCILILVFILSIMAGAVLPSELKIKVFESVGQQFDQIFDQGTSDWLLTWAIFRNNLTVSIITYLLGFLVVLPVLVMLSNGMVVGIFMSLIYRSDVLQPGSFVSGLISLLPHGIFELTAFFISGALSAMVVIKSLGHKYIAPHKKRRRILLESMIGFIGIVVPLLVIAAFMEVYVSEKVALKIQSTFYEDTFDESLAIQLNNDFLQQHNCTLYTDFENKSRRTNVSLQHSLTTIAKILYTPEIYTIYKKNQGAPAWSGWYECDNDLTISIQSWHQTDWSLDEVAQVNTLILNVLEANYTPVNTTRHMLTWHVKGLGVNIPADIEQYTISTVAMDTKTVQIMITDPAVSVNNLLSTDPE